MMDLIYSLLRYFSLFELEIILSGAWSFGVQLVVFFATLFHGVVCQPRNHQVLRYDISVEALSLIHQTSYPLFVYFLC